MKSWLAAAICATSAFHIGSTFASSFSGKVQDEKGLPIAGAMITLSDAKNGIGETVYSSADGDFTLTPRLVKGALQLRVRKPYFKDISRKINVSATKQLRQVLVLSEMKSDSEISDSLPAAYHFGQLPFANKGLFVKNSFQRDCISCHQLGSPLTRFPRSAEAWMSTIERMHGYMGNDDKDAKRIRAEILAEGFNGKPISVRPQFPFSAEIARAKVMEYRIDKGIIPHDAEVSPVDGQVYTVDQFTDSISITNLGTGKTQYVQAPHDGMTAGGKFTKIGLPPPGRGALDVYLGPHSLAFGPDKKWYVTETFANQIGVFDPVTRVWNKSFTIPDVPSFSLYPHTIRFDDAGIAWFTIAFSEQAGRLDPKTGEVTVIPLPPGKSLGIAAGTAPYGIDVNPKDGSVWYTRLWADKIGRIDPKTLTVTEFDSPVKGPRRVRFDRSGALWATGYSEGVIARIDPDGFKSKVFPLPEFAPNYRPAPYALAVNPDTQDIWVAETMTDHMYRFLPKQERWIAYPMPLRGTYTREVSFTKEGHVCTSNSPVPNAALEGGVNELICIEPEAQMDKRQQAALKPRK